MSPLEVARLLMVGIEAGHGPRRLRALHARRRARVPRPPGRRHGRAGREADALGARRRPLLRRRGELVAAHRAKGHTIVVASSALPFQVEPLARELGVDHVLCTRLEERDGVLTGEVDGPILWGPGKAAAVKEFAARARTSISTKSFAYGNGTEDLAVPRDGRPPAALEPDQGPRPRSRASAAGRPPLPARAGGPASQEVVRTAAAYGGLTAGLYAGVGLGLLKRSRKAGMNTTMSLGSDAGLRSPASTLHVDGRGAPVVAPARGVHLQPPELARRLIVDEAAAPRRHRGGQAGGRAPPDLRASSRWLWTSRSSTAATPRRPRAALGAGRRALREGHSLAIAPEGTRSADAAASATSRRARSTSRCRRACRSCRS